MALLFLLQPITTASSSCSMRERLFGNGCCCAEPARLGAPTEAPRSCCAKNARHAAPAQQPAPKHCGCRLSAPPPLLPPADDLRLPSLIGELARQVTWATVSVAVLEHALLARNVDPQGGGAPPGFTSTFHAHLAAGMARALSFERNLRS